MKKTTATFLVFPVLLVATFISGCITPRKPAVNSSAPAQESWKHNVANYEFRLMTDPIFPTATDFVKIEVLLYDISKNPPEPVRGSKISCSATMPDVPGEIHWLANNICYLTETSPGSCGLPPIVFGTGGKWNLDVKAEIPGQEPLSTVFSLNIQGPPWPNNYIPK